MTRALLLLFVILVPLWSKSVRIATYNVENLFDLNFDHSEYVEYIPNTPWQWNSTTYRVKLNNIARVIADIDADIIALQEVESAQALKDLKHTLSRQGCHYPYSAIATAKNTTVRVALLSRYPIAYSKELWVTSSRKFRNILEAKVMINEMPVYFFVNHWKSKSGPESKRIISAKTLKKRLNALRDAAIVVLGDFNSDYHEYMTFEKKRRLNDTQGITGINHILSTYRNRHAITPTELLTCNACLYNLWYDAPQTDRWSHTYKGSHEALDNILISRQLMSGALQYKQHSITHFAPPYLMYKNKPYRWQQSRSYPKHHTAKGYSDHLPVIAEFELK